MCLLTAALIMLAGCGHDKESFALKGSIEGMGDGDIYIYNLSESADRLDTIHVDQGSFAYQASPLDPTVYVLFFANGVEQAFVARGGDQLTYKAQANNLKLFTVTGNEENEQLNQLRQSLNKTSPQEKKKIIGDYIRQHPGAASAVYLFMRHFIQTGDFSDKETRELLSLLDKHHPSNHLLLQANGYIHSAETHQTEATIPDLSIRLKNGKDYPLCHRHSSWLLLTFWTTWVPEGYSFLYTLRELQRQYGDEDIDFVCVSLDNQIFKWEESVKGDSIGILHSCDGLSWESPVVQKTGLGSLPTFLLIDQENKITAQGHDEAQMRQTLSEHVKKQ